MPWAWMTSEVALFVKPKSSGQHVFQRWLWAYVINDSSHGRPLNAYTLDINSIYFDQDWDKNIIHSTL